MSFSTLIKNGQSQTTQTPNQRGSNRLYKSTSRTSNIQKKKDHIKTKIHYSSSGFLQPSC